MANKKTPNSPDPGLNEKISLLFEEIAQCMELSGENDFKVRAYRKGAAALLASGQPLEDVANGAVKVAGVGEGLKAAIQEFLETGTIKAKEELSRKIPSAVLEFLKVPGLGPKKALIVQKELGLNSIGELEYACRENRLLGLKGFGKTMQDKVLSGIEQLKASEGKYRIDEAFDLAAQFEDELRVHLGQRAKIAKVGALGRLMEVVEVFEFFFSSQPASAAIALKALARDGALQERRERPFSIELVGLSGRSSQGFRFTCWVSERDLDLETEQWLCAHEKVRADLALHPHRFEKWEPTWLEPDWIESGRKPASSAYRRSRDGSVKGIFHCHTNFSDGSATLEQMVRAAEERGYEYIGISDHSQTAFYAQGLKAERLREQREMIKALQKQVSIRIFHGVESDILADGALDYDEETLASLDFIVGSIHSRFKMEEAAMTERLVQALSNPYITIWGHPTGRLLLGRKGYGLDWDACIKAATAGDVAIEINANPARLDVDWRLGERLEKSRAFVCINPDAHSVEGLDDTKYGEYMAEKAMIPRDRILNAMGVEEMEHYLLKRKQSSWRNATTGSRRS